MERTPRSCRTRCIRRLRLQALPRRQVEHAVRLPRGAPPLHCQARPRVVRSKPLLCVRRAFEERCQLTVDFSGERQRQDARQSRFENQGRPQEVDHCALDCHNRGLARRGCAGRSCGCGYVRRLCSLGAPPLDETTTDERAGIARTERITLAPLKTLISSLATRTNYGLSLSSLGSDYALPDGVKDVPTTLQYWVWEVEDEEMWVEEMKAKWEKRKAEREEVSSLSCALSPHACCFAARTRLDDAVKLTLTTPSRRSSRPASPCSSPSPSLKSTLFCSATLPPPRKRARRPPRARGRARRRPRTRPTKARRRRRRTRRVARRTRSR